MSGALAVFKRELKEAVGTRGFILATILVPAGLVGIVALMIFFYTRSAGGMHTIAIVDASGHALGDPIRERLARTDVRMRLEVIEPRDTTAARALLESRIAADSLDGYLWVSAETMSGGAADYVGSNAANEAVTSAVRRALNASVQGARLERAGVDTAKVAAALVPVTFKAVRLSEAGKRTSAKGTRMTAMGMGALIYVVVVLYGMGIMSIVVEEKRDRVAESLLTCVTARDLLYGKIFGAATAAVIQILMWLVSAAALFRWGADLARAIGVSPEIAARLHTALASVPLIPAPTLALYVAFFLGGFLLYTSLYGALGAAVQSQEEAQPFAFPMLAPLMVSFLMLEPALDAPEGGIALFGSLFPLTAPVIMPARAVVLDVPAWQLAVAAMLLAATIAGVIWSAAKVYRIGILATGKRPSLPDVWRWLRAA